MRRPGNRRNHRLVLRGTSDSCRFACVRSSSAIGTRLFGSAFRFGLDTADDQLHAGQPALDEQAQEGTERLRLGLADVEGEHLLVAGLVDALGEHERLGHDAAAVSDLLDLASSHR
jgi:hypothetical protein